MSGARKKCYHPNNCPKIPDFFSDFLLLSYTGRREAPSSEKGAGEMGGKNKHKPKNTNMTRN